MKLSSFFVATLATMGSLVTMAAADTVEFTTDISFTSPNEIVDTPESLATLEEAIIRASDASHDPDAWHLVSETVQSASHAPIHTRRELRAWLQYGRTSTWYGNQYRTGSTSDCNACRRRLGQRDLSAIQDDPESHAKWEATLCSILAETAHYAGVTDCAITFVDPEVTPVAEEKVKYYTDITFKTTSPVFDTAALLEAFELAMLMSADNTHDPDSWFLDSTEVVSFSHYTATSDDEGERKLRAWLQYGSTSSWYGNQYRTGSTSDCNACRRRKLTVAKDDDESHAKWEAALCELLNDIDGMDGVTDCVITFVEE